jgi:hypothetical protein
VFYRSPEIGQFLSSILVFVKVNITKVSYKDGSLSHLQFEISGRVTIILSQKLYASVV